MKHKVYLACTCAALAAAACASSEADPGVVDPGGPDSSASVVDEGDAATPRDDVDAGGDGAAPDAGPSCSPRGWCVTRLPDSDLTFRDLWAFPGRALAIATSATLGVRVLEWTEASGAWSYIDDNAQNESGHGAFVGKMWAPSPDELYFTVAPHTVFRGTRSASPGTWSWTHWELEDRIPVYTAPTFQYPNHYKGLPRQSDGTEHAALGVFGTSAGEVYAWFANAIYKLSSDDAGVPTWSVEYVADDIARPDEQLFFVAATGTAPDDLWFAGGRTGNPNDTKNCAMVVHKTAGTYRRVADAVRDTSAFPTFPSKPPCATKPGTVLVEGKTGWLTDIAVESSSSVVALKASSVVARITVSGDVYSSSVFAVPGTITGSVPLFSMWTTPSEPIWLGGTRVLARGADIWDGGAFELSSISLNGAPLDTVVHRVRGSSNSDRWAVGARYALHKTTP